MWARCQLGWMSLYLEVAAPMADRSSIDVARQVAIHGWYTADEVGQELRRAGQDCDVDKCRRSGSLFGVWVPEEGVFRYAPWQFDGGGLCADMAEVLGLLRGPDGVAAGRRHSGWEELEWFLAPHALVGGRPPARLFGRPGAVLDLAKTDFSAGSRDGRW